jgi:hypothetical protein
MAHNALETRISRRSWLLAGLAIPLSRLRAAEPLNVRFDGDNLHVSTPGLHFLTGKPLERLKNADNVVYLSQLTILSDSRGTLFRQPTRERLIVSYDLWEEKFAVAIPGPLRRTQSHLTAAQAEQWCIENLAISALGLAPDRPFWLRFELRTTAQKDLSSLVGESGISLSGLMIDVLSRRLGADDLYWTRTAGPLRLADLPRSFAGRGTRIG